MFVTFITKAVWFDNKIYQPLIGAVTVNQPTYIITNKNNDETIDHNVNCWSIYGFLYPQERFCAKYKKQFPFGNHNRLSDIS